MKNETQTLSPRVQLHIAGMRDAIAAHAGAQIAIAKTRPTTRTLAEWTDVKIKTEWHTFNFFSAQLSVIYDDCDKFCSVVLSDCLQCLKLRRQNKINRHWELFKSAAGVVSVTLSHQSEKDAIKDDLQLEFGDIQSDMIAAERRVASIFNVTFAK